MKRRFDLYLRDMVEAIKRVERYTGGLIFEEFREDSLVVDAVLRNLEVIGEAVAQLPEDIRQRHPVVPWRDIKAFRNVVAHHYWEIHFERVWDIIENKLKPLKRQVEDILKEGAVVGEGT